MKNSNEVDFAQIKVTIYSPNLAKNHQSRNLKACYRIWILKNSFCKYVELGNSTKDLPSRHKHVDTCGLGILTIQFHCPTTCVQPTSYFRLDTLVSGTCRLFRTCSRMKTKGNLIFFMIMRLILVRILIIWSKKCLTIDRKFINRIHLRWSGWCPTDHRG